MKVTATPVLEGSDAKSIDIDDLDSRTFVDLLDHNKAVLFQKKKNAASNGEEPNGDGDGDESTVFTIEEFGDFVVNLELEYYPYIGGAAPRTIIPVQASSKVNINGETGRSRDIIYTANESPADQPIPFHHELAQTANPPNYVFFYCDVAPDEGSGQTPIIDSTKVYRYVKERHAEFLSKLMQHGARYTRSLPAFDDPKTPIGRSYKNTWNVCNEKELEEKLSKIDGCTWTWMSADDPTNVGNERSVRITTEAVPAIRLIPDHADNYVFQYAFANSIIAAHVGWVDIRNDPTKALSFGNNDAMPSDVLDDIAKYMHQNRVLYSWKKGDIMALNNQLVMHSRNPYTSSRRVLASIWGPPKLKSTSTTTTLTNDSSSSWKTPSDRLVFGFWKVSKDICSRVCYDAIKAGYRRLDCACDYGNEVEVGNGIQKAIKDGLCKREELFITSKLWNTFHKPEHVKLAIEKTLKDLQLHYVDEYLIHFPISMEYIPIEQKYPPEWTNLDGKMVLVSNNTCETWSAMEQLVDNGLTKTIGICNFSTQLIRQLLSTCRIQPSTLQVEIHPHNTQQKLVKFAQHDAGMQVTAFSIMGASSYLELNMATQQDVLITNPVIEKIAKHHNKTCAQILIRWCLQRNIQPLCKTTKYHRMLENRNIYDFYLSTKQMESIHALNKNHRYNDPGVFCLQAFGTFCPIYD